MQRLKYDLDVKAANAAGNALDCDGCIHQTVILRPGKVGLVVQSVLQLQVSNSGKKMADLVDADFVNYGSAVSDGNSTPVTLELEAWTYLRVVTSVYVGGTPSATWSGDRN